MYIHSEMGVEYSSYLLIVIHCISSFTEVGVMNFMFPVQLHRLHSVKWEVMTWLWIVSR